MEWIKWLFIIFFGTPLALLIYSIASTTTTIRKKIQPLVDGFFDVVYHQVFRRRASSERDDSRRGKRE